MRSASSYRRWATGDARGLRRATPVPHFRSAAIAAAVGLAAWLASAAPAQLYDFSDRPLLATSIAELDVHMRGRYVRQWRADDGSLVVLYNGRFELEMGARRLRADNAVVWVEPRQTEPEGRKYYRLTVYLSGDAEVREVGGTVTIDTVLLVSGLETYGRILKEQDVHAVERADDSALYQDALRDRALVEGGERSPRMAGPEIVRPAETRAVEVERPPRVVRYRLPIVEPARTPAGEPVVVATGGVYFTQAGGPDAPLLEIRAQSAVVFPAEGATETFFGEPEPPPETTQPPPPPEGPFVQPPAEGRPARPPVERQAEAEAESTFGLGGDEARRRIRAVYLEDDVVLSLGNRFVRADRIYYDFERDRALILDAVFRADVPEREVPLYVRAAEIRQLSAREIAAEGARVTTSEFHTPSYHIGADRIYLRDLTARDATGRTSGPVTGLYEMYDATLNVGGVPLLWWPYSTGRLEASETLLRSFRTGYSSDRGYELETRWYLFNLLGLSPPPGYDATLRVDYFSDRGPALGVDADYAGDDHYGLLRSYYIHDEGFDTLGPLRRSQEQPSTSERGRILWRHRQYLPRGWEATLEAAYISDPYFLEEYEKSEWFEGKEQETLLYLKKAKGTQAVTLLANWRLLDFVTQTEHLPELTYRRIGDTFLDPLVLYHESRIGAVRYRLDDRHFIDEPRFNTWGNTDVTFRTDARQEAELPLKLGPLNVVPFASFRGTYWDGQPLADGGLWRGLGVYGVRGGSSFSRVYDDVQSQRLDIHRIRHIVQPQFAAWWAHSNTRSELLSPFDYGIETIDDFYGFRAALQQIWQTKRGSAERRQTIDLLTVNLELGLFGNVEDRDDVSNGYANPLRPENSRTRNYFAGDVIYRIGATTSLLYDFNVDLNDGSYDRHNVALAVERSPRLAYVFGTRYAGDIDMNLIGGGWNYRFTEKHFSAVRVWHDIDTGELGEIAVGYVRRLPRWNFGINFEYDNIDDDFSVTVSLWPEGIPEWTVGSRRFTGLTSSTGIRP